MALDPDPGHKQRAHQGLLATPKNHLFWLVLSTFFLSCLSQNSEYQQIHEIFRENGENHNIVRRDVTEKNPGSQPQMSNLAIATKLNSSHLHLMVHWAGQGSPVIFVLARSQKMDLNANSKVYISKDYGKTFEEKSQLFQIQNGTNAIIAKFYHHPQSNCHYVFTDTVNR